MGYEVRRTRCGRFCTFFREWIERATGDGWDKRRAEGVKSKCGRLADVHGCGEGGIGRSRESYGNGILCRYAVDKAERMLVLRAYRICRYAMVMYCTASPRTPAEAIGSKVL